MPDYKTMYFTLFSAITDAMQAVYDALPVSEVMRILNDAQLKTEEMYIDTYDEFPEPEETENSNEE